jgi:hypothetical protein
VHAGPSLAVELTDRTTEKRTTRRRRSFGRIDEEPTVLDDRNETMITKKKQYLREWFDWDTTRDVRRNALPEDVNED